MSRFGPDCYLYDGEMMRNSGEPPAKRPRVAWSPPDTSSDVIDVVAGRGPEEKIFHIHKAVFAQSPCLNAATKPKWMHEGGDKSIDLADESRVVVDAYIGWLYTRNISVQGKDKFESLGHLYVLGEKMLHVESQNSVIDKFLAHSATTNTLPTSSIVAKIYDGTPEGSPVRRMLVDIFYYCLPDDQGGVLFTNNMPHEFVCNCMKKLLENRRRYKNSRPGMLNTAKYYKLEVEQQNK